MIPGGNRTFALIFSFLSHKPLVTGSSPVVTILDVKNKSRAKRLFYFICDHQKNLLEVAAEQVTGRVSLGLVPGEPC